MARKYFEIGERCKFSSGITAGLCWKNEGGYTGVLIWARDESTGYYFRIYEVSEADSDGWIQGKYEGSYTRGNFETVDDAKRFASAAYRKLNRRKSA